MLTVGAECSRIRPRSALVGQQLEPPKQEFVLRLKLDLKDSAEILSFILDVITPVGRERKNGVETKNKGRNGKWMYMRLQTPRLEGSLLGFKSFAYQLPRSVITEATNPPPPPKKITCCCYCHCHCYCRRKSGNWSRGAGTVVVVPPWYTTPV